MKKTVPGKASLSVTEQTALHVSSVSLIINLALSILKLLAGIIASSGAMVSDSVHSASDVFSTIIVMIGVHLSEMEADHEHPYGHERLECVAAFILSVMLAGTGAFIGYQGLLKILRSGEEAAAVPGLLALLAALLSISVKEWMYHYTIRAAKKIHSGALKADAWHHRSDALSSIGALVGIFFARAGFPLMDPIASIIICLFIFKSALDIFRDAMDKMVDRACPDETVHAMQELILAQSDVSDIVWMKTRQFGARSYVDVTIAVDGSKSLTAAHEIAAQVHDQIESHFPDVKHCMVHEDPQS